MFKLIISWVLSGQECVLAEFYISVRCDLDNNLLFFLIQTFDFTIAQHRD